MSPLSADDVILPAPQARREHLGGISDMTLWRWIQDPEMGFPRPIYINKRRYFRLAEIREFKQRQGRMAA